MTLFIQFEEQKARISEIEVAYGPDTERFFVRFRANNKHSIQFLKKISNGCALKVIRDDKVVFSLTNCWIAGERTIGRNYDLIIVQEILASYDQEFLKEVMRKQ